MTTMTHALLTRREGVVLILSNHNPAARHALTPEFYWGIRAALDKRTADFVKLCSPAA
jgi:enoyl-CoA hydratase/carnithine racemase